MKNLRKGVYVVENISYPKLLDIFRDYLILNISLFFKSQNVGIVQDKLSQLLNIRTAKYNNAHISSMMYFNDSIFIRNSAD